MDSKEKSQENVLAKKVLKNKMENKKKLIKSKTMNKKLCRKNVTKKNGKSCFQELLNLKIILAQQSF